MTELKIARGFALPLDLVTEATAIVATRGAGKSSASAVLIEEAFALGVQSVVFDRTGVYWGLRSNAKGDGPGLAIYVLGGPHGDVPLEPHAGAMIADLVVDSGHSFVLDLSDFSKANAVKFAAAFLERLYDRKARARTTTLLVMDEAHFYAPQTPRGGFKGDAARLMGAMEDIVGLGRSRGLGVILTTQRTQALNKAVLDLIETLLVMRMLSPRARSAVKDWIQEKHEDDEQGVIATLDSLPTGTAWVWSPLRGVLEKVALRRIKTFDSFKTPTAGEAMAEPTARRNLDLDALGEQMRSTAERAKENDPAELRKRVRELEHESDDRLARIRALEAQPETQTVEVEKVVEVPALRDVDVEELARQVDRLFALRDEILSSLHDVAGAATVLTEQAKEATDAAAARANAGTRPAARPVQPLRPPASAPERRNHSAAPRDGSQRVGAVPGDASATGDVQLKAGARRILETFARHHPMRMTKAQLGTLAKFKITGGTFQTYWSTLKRAGYVEEQGGECWITDAGLERVGHVTQEPLTTDELLAMWRSALKAGARAMLDQLVEFYDAPLTKDELAERVGMTASGGTFQTYLSTLRRNGLVEIDGNEVRASSTLFIGAAA